KDAMDQSNNGLRASARNPAVSGAAAVLGSGFTKTKTVVAAIVMRTAVPRKGARQEIVPKVPPTKGPSAMPNPTAASYKIMAEADPPVEAPTMPAKAMVTNRAFPNPQPARSPMTCPMVSESPAMLANTTMINKPVTNVVRIPIRAEITPAKNMVQAVTKRYDVNSNMDSNAVASSACAIVGRIGDTRPIPTKDTAVANVIAQTLA